MHGLQSRLALFLAVAALIACGARSSVPWLEDEPTDGPAATPEPTTTPIESAAVPAGNIAVDPPPATRCRSGRGESVDQANVERQNASTRANVAGQTFRPSRAGTLTAIETAVYRCDEHRDGALRLTLREGRSALGKVIATALASAPVTQRCDIVYLPLLHPIERGPTTFDFTNECIALEADRDYSFTIETVDTEQLLVIGTTVPSGVGSAFDGYPRGTQLAHVDGKWQTGHDIGMDLAFKAYLEP